MNETNEELENWFDKGIRTKEVVTAVKDENAAHSEESCAAVEMPQSEVKVTPEQVKSDDASSSMPAEGEVAQTGAGDEKGCLIAQYEAKIAELQALCEKDKKDIEFYKEREKKAKEEVAAEQAEREQARARHQKKVALEKRAAVLVGDGSYAKISELVTAYVTAQLEADDKTKLQKLLKEAEDANNQFSIANDQLNSDNQRLIKEQIELKAQIEELDSALKKCKCNLEMWESIGMRMKSAIVPQCLSGREWFNSLLEDMNTEIGKDTPDDSAILLLASISEFAVMERCPAAACFEWRKQLSDIGLVVANYMHQKKVAEIEVFKMLRNFAMALRESKTIAQLKISLKVPELGPDFNVDEVKHLKNGSAVAKILNWCLIDSNGVFSKAIVE